MNKTIIGVLAVAVIAIGGFFFPQVKPVVQQVVQNLGANPGPTFLDRLEFLGGVTSGSVNSTSTVASMTLRVSDVQDFDTVIVSPTGAASTKTLTFFASSTASSWIPLAGQVQKTCFYNSTTTTGATITFAAGTGIDLQSASSSPTDLILSADNTACFTFARKGGLGNNLRDITASFVEYKDAD